MSYPSPQAASISRGINIQSKQVKAARAWHVLPFHPLFRPPYMGRRAVRVMGLVTEGGGGKGLSLSNRDVRQHLIKITVGLGDMHHSANIHFIEPTCGASGSI